MKFTASCSRCQWKIEYHGSAAAAGRMTLRAAFKHKNTAQHLRRKPKNEMGLSAKVPR